MSSPRRLSERDTASIRPRSWVESSAASSSSFLASAAARLAIGLLEIDQGCGELSCGGGEPFARGVQSVSSVWPEFCSARASTCWRTSERKTSAAPSGVPAWMRRGPAGAGQRMRGIEHGIQVLFGELVIRDEIAHPLAQAAAAPPELIPAP